MQIAPYRDSTETLQQFLSTRGILRMKSYSQYWFSFPVCVGNESLVLLKGSWSWLVSCSLHLRGVCFPCGQLMNSLKEWQRKNVWKHLNPWGKLWIAIRALNDICLRAVLFQNTNNKVFRCVIIQLAKLTKIGIIFFCQFCQVAQLNRPLITLQSVLTIITNFAKYQTTTSTTGTNSSM